MATLALNIGMQALGPISKLLGQHTLRLHDAQNENAAAAQAVQAFDADVAQVVQTYNNGGISKGDALSALGAIDQQIMNFLQAQVGKPGTSWVQQPTGAANGGCNKQCTVGCCLYYDDFHPGILNVQRAIQAGSGNAKIPQVYGNKYGLQTRAGYTLVVTTPAINLSTPAGAVSSITSAFSTTVKVLEGDVFGGTTNGNTVGGSPGLEMKPLLIVIGVILAVVFLFRLVRY